MNGREARESGLRLEASVAPRPGTFLAVQYFPILRRPAPARGGVRRAGRRRRACDCRMGPRQALDVGRLADHQGCDRRAHVDQGSRPQLYDRTTPMGRGFMAMLSALTEDERLRIVERTHEGRQLARDNGVKMAASRSSRSIRSKKHGGGLPKVRRRARSPRDTASAAAREAERRLCGSYSRNRRVEKHGPIRFSAFGRFGYHNVRCQGRERSRAS